MEDFTRQETLALTGATSSRLAYLDRAELVKPLKLGKSIKPTVLYTWQQLLEIRAIANLKQKIPLPSARKVIRLFGNANSGDNLRDDRLVIIGDDVWWVKADWSNMPEVMKMADNKNFGHFTAIVIPPLSSLVEDIWISASSSSTVDFASFQLRAKAQPDNAV